MVNLVVTKPVATLATKREIKSNQNNPDDFSNETINKNLSIDQLFSSKETRRPTIDSPKENVAQMPPNMLIHITSHHNEDVDQLVEDIQPAKIKQP